MTKSAGHQRPAPVVAIEQMMRLQPLYMLSRYLDAGSLAAFDSTFRRSAKLYDRIRIAADYGSEQIDGREIFYFHRRGKDRRQQFEFVFKFYAHDGVIIHDAIEVCWCEIPLEDLLQQCVETDIRGLQKFTVYLYDDEHLHLGSVLFANGRSLDFTASADGEGFIVVMLYGKSDGDKRRAADVQARMVEVGSTRNTLARVQKLARFLQRSGS